MRLAVLSPLCVSSLTPHGCRQTAASALKSAAGEQFDFEIEDPDADVEIALTRRSADVRATCATTTVFGLRENEQPRRGRFPRRQPGLFAGRHHLAQLDDR